MRNHLFGFHPTRRPVISLTRMRSLDVRICESSTADIGIRARARQSAARGLSRPQRSMSSSNSWLKNPSFDESGVIYCGHESVATPERAAPPCRRWIAFPFGCLLGFLCVTSAPVRGWVIEGGSLGGKDSSSASSRFASSSAVCALVSAFLFMGTFPVRHSAINRELRSVAELSHSSYRVKTRILLSASQPFWTRLRSTLARRLAVEGPFGTMGIELQTPVANDLQRHAADLRRLGARRPLIDRSQGEKPPRLWPILCLFRYRAKTRRIKIPPSPIAVDMAISLRSPR